MPAKILALIPAFNEAARVAPVVEQARTHLPVLVVDDGSTDDTSTVAQAAGAIVVRQEPNQGKGTALQRGFRYALEEGFDAVLTLDADGQHDPAEMPLFIDTFAATFPETAPDLIIGRRRFRQMPWVRR
ncbi:MAG: glycosyltransferase family 2 protein, partial [Caldilineaceae bacterium]|nr:glycosyltransferase family 2 protein [Caldilineaceae bacterium]